MYYPSCFCLPDDKALMHGQTVQPVMMEDVYDESHWTSEQVTILHAMIFIDLAAVQVVSKTFCFDCKFATFCGFFCS